MELKEIDNATKTVLIKVTKEELLAIKNAIANLSQEVDEIDYTALLGVTIEEIQKLKIDLKTIYSSLNWAVSDIKY